MINNTLIIIYQSHNIKDTHQIVICECGDNVIYKTNYNNHIKTDIHFTYLENNNMQTEQSIIHRKEQRIEEEVQRKLQEAEDKKEEYYKNEAWINCDCGGCYRFKNKEEHEVLKYHIKYIKSLERKIIRKQKAEQLKLKK